MPFRGRRREIPTNAGAGIAIGEMSRGVYGNLNVGKPAPAIPSGKSLRISHHLF